MDWLRRVFSWTAQEPSEESRARQSSVRILDGQNYLVEIKKNIAVWMADRRRLVFSLLDASERHPIDPVQLALQPRMASTMSAVRNSLVLERSAIAFLRHADGQIENLKVHRHLGDLTASEHLSVNKPLWVIEPDPAAFLRRCRSRALEAAVQNNFEGLLAMADDFAMPRAMLGAAQELSQGDLAAVVADTCAAHYDEWLQRKQRSESAERGRARSEQPMPTVSDANTSTSTGSMTSRDEKSQPTASDADTSTRSAPMASIDIFISHSSSDLALATLLADLLVRALALEPSVIRCTSVAAYRLPTGAHASTTLREEIENARVFIGLLTPQSLTSSYVLFELGARWGVGKPLSPVIGPTAEHNMVKAPLSEFHIAKTTIRSDVLQLIEEVAQKLERKVRPAYQFDRELAQLLAAS